MKCLKNITFISTNIFNINFINDIKLDIFKALFFRMYLKKKSKKIKNDKKTIQETFLSKDKNQDFICSTL